MFLIFILRFVSVSLGARAVGEHLIDFMLIWSLASHFFILLQQNGFYDSSELNIGTWGELNWNEGEILLLASRNIQLH